MRPVALLVRYVLFCVLLCLLLASANANAVSTGLIVSGLGGNSDYDAVFSESAKTIREALQTISADKEDIVLLQGDAVSRQSVLAAIEQTAARATDTYYLLLVGHGTVDSESWRFNVPGEDISTADIVTALSTVQAQTQVVVLGTSASGATLDILSQPGRMVVTATKSGGELNVVRFPEFFAEAMSSTVADTDRNEILTLAEAWKFANDRTQDYYTDLKLLASEHARLTGDNPQNVAMARLGALRAAGDDPLVAEMLERRLQLENEFVALKAQKLEMDTLIYYEKLEPLLVDIALLQQEIDAATGWGVTNE